MVGCNDSSSDNSTSKDTITEISKVQTHKKSSVLLPVSFIKIKDLLKNKRIQKQTWSGYYTGDFEKNKLTIHLLGIYEDSIFGYSICAGNFSELRGLMIANNIKIFEEKAQKHSGEFEMVLRDSMLEGIWKPYSVSSDKQKSFSLHKREAIYNNSNGSFPMASQRELSVEDVENVLPEDLKIMINEIYARYGYCFYKKEARYYFEQQPWYMPTTTYVGNRITELEWKNIGLVSEYVKYYEESLDEFGR